MRGLRSAFKLELLDNRFPALHGLRVLAILSVVQYHVTSLWSEEPGGELGAFADLSTRLFFGMDLFFVLSGFLIGTILLRTLESRGTIHVGRFYFRRVIRTFPSYYLVLTTLALLLPLTPDQRRHLPWEYLYGTNLLPVRRSVTVMFWGWSLAFEEQFYLVAPWLLFAVHRLRSRVLRYGALLALWLTPLFLRVLHYSAERSPSYDELWLALYTRPHTRADTLIAGVILAFAYAEWRAPIEAWMSHAQNRAKLILLTVACATWLLLQAHETSLGLMFAWGTVTSIMHVALTLLVLHGDGPMHRFLGARAFRAMATLGYGVYLIHIPVYQHAIQPIAKGALTAGVSVALVWSASLAVLVALSLFGAYLLHIAVEKPSLWLRERYFANL